MASRRFRSRRSLGNTLNFNDRRLAYLEKRPGPRRLQPQVVTTDKLVRAAIVTDVIDNAAVVEEKIDDNQVSTRTIAPVAVTNTEVANSAVDNRTIQTDAIDARTIRANAITADEVSADAITAGKISADAITAREISADAITAEQISANAVTAEALTANAVTAGKIDADAITAREISADAVTASEISANAVTAEQLSANAVTAGKIDADAITAREIRANAITASEISAGSISSEKIVAGGITANVITSGTINAATVNVTNINASNITAGTLTGRTVRTSSSGNRVELSNSNQVRFFSGGQVGTISPTGTGGTGLMLSGAAGATYPYFYAGSGRASSFIDGNRGIGITPGNNVIAGSTRFTTRVVMSDLAGSSTRMVVARGDGALATQAIASGPPGPPGPIGPRGPRGFPGPASDRRLKKAVNPTPLGLDFINKLRPVSFVWKTDNQERVQYGLIAQEVESLFEQEGIGNYGVVFRDGEKYKGKDTDDKTPVRKLDYYQFISPMIRSIQELTSRVEELERKAL